MTLEKTFEEKVLEKTDMTLEEHYEFYVDDLPKNEIPINFEEWKREYSESLFDVLNLTTTDLPEGDL